jgi:hypothetical protein
MKPFLFAITLLAFNALGQKNPFPTLKTVTLNDFNTTATFGYDPTCVHLINKKCINLPISDFFHCDNEEMEVAYKLVMFKNTSIKDSITIMFTFGMSMDPEFIFVDNKHNVIGRIYALELYLHANGSIYSSGHTNNMFDKRRKFELKSDTILEVIQPFYYIGLKTVTLEPLTLYASQTSKEVVAVIPKDYEIEVVLAEFKRGEFVSEKYFLIKTKFGLIGWINIEGSNNPKVKGVFFAGD